MLTDVQELRRMTQELTEDTYTNEDIEQMLADLNNDLNAVAAKMWTEKAGRLAGLINTSEGGSSRALGDLHKNALSMAEHFGSLSTAAGGSARRSSRTRAVERA